MSTSATPNVVQLPKRSESIRKAATTSPLWPLTSEQEDPTAAVETVSKQQTGPPMKTICEKATMPDSVCCRTLKGDEERHLLDPAIVRDIIIGLSDGLTVPFGLTAGLAAAGSSRIVVIGGVAELIAGALSMGVGGGLATQAERDHYRYLRRTTMARVKRSCAGELEREVAEVLAGVGVDEQTCRKVATSLMKVESQVLDKVEEVEEDPRKDRSTLHALLRMVARKPRTTSDYEMGSSPRKSGSVDDMGLTAFLLKFGEGMEEVPTSRIFRSAFTIGLAYAIGGLAPLLPYFFIHEAKKALFVSIGVTAAALVIFGLLKAYHTGAKLGVSGYLKSAVYTLFVGAVAAGGAYGICAAIEAHT